MNFSHILFGGDYNPDQWPEEIWIEDVRLMREAGVNHVSMGIFPWARFEPRRSEYDFDWLDRLMDLLHKNGVSVNLSTPTASLPAWLVRRAPEILPVTEGGTTLWHGARRHYCPHSAVYHEHATNIVTKLAERYAKHPALVMWHVDNKYACHSSECFCDVSAASFRDWLVKEICEIVGIKSALANSPTDVEAVKRVSKNSSWLFLFNHTATKLGVQLETIGHDLLTGREVKDFVELEPSGIAIIQSPAQ